MPLRNLIFKRGVESESITVEDMRVIEANSAWWGVSQDILMENAGRALGDFILDLTGGARSYKIAVVSGRGGNGGDGMVAARHLASMGFSVELHLTHEPQSVTHRATARMLEYILKSKTITVKKPWDSGWLDLRDADIVIDAILGTGVRGEPRGAVRMAIDALNSVKKTKIAADIPSGLDPDTGDAVLAVKADFTLSFHKPKRGLFLNKGPDYAGEVYVAEIGVPVEAETYTGPGEIIRIPEKSRDARKGDGGRILVIGGSERFVGAPILAAKAAYRAGADLVYAYLPGDYVYTVASCHPEILPCPRRSGVMREELGDLVDKVHSIIVGPGLGLGADSRRIVEEALDQLRGKPVVFDADALKIIAELEAKLWPGAVMTPHRGEARLLSGLPEASLLEQARVIASKYNAAILLKAPEDVICEPGGLCKRNATGHQAMSVGGTGDVLAGVVAEFMARRVSRGLPPNPFASASAAAFIVGRAGELAVAEKSEYITPQDVIDKIPDAIREARSIAGST